MESLDRLQNVLNVLTVTFENTTIQYMLKQHTHEMLFNLSSLVLTLDKGASVIDLIIIVFTSKRSHMEKKSVV